MAATIEINGIEAMIEEYHWTSKDATLAGILNTLLDPLGPSGADPNPDLHAAQAAVAELGGEVVSYDETEYEEGRVY